MNHLTLRADYHQVGSQKVRVMEASSDKVFDELLVTLARAGDRLAAERLAARWYPRLLRTARRLLQNDDQARDAAQETWAGICRGWPGLSDARKFPAWAFSILHRKCADRISLEQRERGRLGTDLKSDDIQAPGNLEDGLSISQAFAALNPHHRVAATLYFGEGLTASEVAIATDVPVGTAKSRIFHARRQLKAALKGDDA
jgi:RNA polymerase sigma factor (sigma-70 family)